MAIEDEITRLEREVYSDPYNLAIYPRLQSLLIRAKRPKKAYYFQILSNLYAGKTDWEKVVAAAALGDETAKMVESTTLNLDWSSTNNRDRILALLDHDSLISFLFDCSRYSITIFENHLGKNHYLCSYFNFLVNLEYKADIDLPSIEEARGNIMSIGDSYDYDDVRDDFGNDLSCVPYSIGYAIRALLREKAPAPVNWALLSSSNSILAFSPLYNLRAEAVEWQRQRVIEYLLGNV